MKSFFRVSLLTALLGFSTGIIAEDQLPRRDNYAYGFPLSVQGSSEFYALDVPLALYRSVADSELRDAGVFNAAGQPVPRMFEHAPPEEIDIESRLGLGLVPLFGEQPGNPEQMRLLLRSADGTTLEYAAPDGGGAPQAPGDKPLAAYIVDTRQLASDHQSQPSALEFTWAGNDDGFVGKVIIQDSDDLQAWRALASGTLADLQYEDTLITQNRVSLPRQPASYLRITWQDMPAGWALSALHGIYASQGVAVRRDSISLDEVRAGAGQPARAIAGVDQQFIFDLGGYPPVDRLNLLLPDENIVLRASIFYRHAGESQWLRAHSGLFYHIKRQGHSVQSEPASMAVIRARHWRVVIHSGVIATPPRLQLGWYPDQLVFLAQGTPPFELVAGRARDRLDQFPLERVLGDRSIFQMLRQSGQAGTASMGPRMDIAGANNLQVAPRSPWKTALLWLGLGGAVILVGRLVWSLMRDMNKV